ncbi:hypothetical protein SK128_022772, partial [Halocaridina rubra]
RIPPHIQSRAIGHSRLLVQPHQANYVPFLHTRRNNNGRRRSPPSRFHQYTLPPVLHASPASVDTAPIPTVAIRVTGPGPLDTQPRMRNAVIATRLVTTTDVARIRTRVRIAPQVPVVLPLLPEWNMATVVTDDASILATPSPQWTSH